jgi:hypothetical protein
MRVLKQTLSVILTFALILTSISVFGQGTDFTDGAISEDTYSGLGNFTESIEWVYGFLVIVTGYLSVFIPGLNKIDKSVYRVLALAVVIGAAFFFGGETSIFNLVITYTISTSFYETILKLFAKTPKNKEVIASS